MRIVGRPTPLYVVQKRLEWGPRWLQRLLPYRAASRLHSRPQDARAEAFSRFLLFDQPELAAAVTRLDPPRAGAVIR